MVQQLLAAWRDAERRLELAEDPVARTELQLEVERLRAEYQAAVEAAAGSAAGEREPTAT